MPGVNLGDLISRAAKKGIFLSGGGHAMAAGLSIEPSRLDDLRDFLEAETQGATFELAEARVLEIDGALGPGAANGALLDMVERVGPFGSGAPEPLFAVPNVRAAGARGSARTMWPSTWSARTARACAPSPSAWPTARRASPSPRAAPLHVAGRLRADTWRGNGACR